MVRAAVPEAGLVWPESRLRLLIVRPGTRCWTRLYFRFLICKVGRAHGPLRRIKRGPFRAPPRWRIQSRSPLPSP